MGERQFHLQQVGLIWVKALNHANAMCGECLIYPYQMYWH